MIGDNKEYSLYTCDVVRILSDMKSFRSNSLSFLNEVLEAGGYVSGGFARTIGNLILLGSKENPARVKNYLGCDVGGDGPLNPGTRNSRMWKRDNGDIDVFFHNEVDVQAAIDKISTSGTWTWNADTIGGYGREFLAGGIVFQLIHGIHGSPRDVLETFDIENAKVYFNERGLYLSNDWLELERKKQLGICRADKLNLLWRVRKWFRKHGYTSLRDGDSHKLFSAIERLLSESGSERLFRWNSRVPQKRVQGIARNAIDFLSSADDLLRLSMYLDDYGQMEVIKALNGGKNERR